MTEIGINIMKRRKELGMTQEELATLIGYKSKSTINKIELGINDIVQSKVAKFAEVLNTTPAYIMGWEEEDGRTDLTTDDSCSSFASSQLFQNYEALNDKGKKEAEKRVEELTYIPIYTKKTDILQAAHARTDIDITEDMIKNDDDIMSDENF